MEDFLTALITNGSGINQIILSVIFIWLMLFVTKYWWPERIEHNKRQQEIERELSLKEIESTNDTQNQLISKLDVLNSSILALHASLNDFLQNMLSQTLEERKEHYEQINKIIDTGIFHQDGTRKSLQRKGGDE